MAEAAQTVSRPEESAGRRTGLQSLLLLDCGSTFTTAALIGIADDQPRLFARATHPSTSAPPQADIAIGALAAVGEIERITGRLLVRDGRLITPMQPDGSGVDALALVTSVGGPLRIFATGPGRDTLAALLYRAVSGLFAKVEHLPPISEPPYDAPTLQAIDDARALTPHAILIVGAAFEGGRGRSALDSTAQVVGRWLDALSSAPTETLEETQPAPLPVIFSGAPDDAAHLQAALRDSAPKFQATQALSPSSLTPLNRAVGALYESAVLRPLPGYERLRRLAVSPPMATITSLGGLARFLAQRFGMNIVVADVGANSTLLAGATSQGDFVPGIQPSMGVGAGAGRLLRAVGATAILRWIPFELDENALREYVMTRMLRPHAIPASKTEIEIEHALAREALRMALHAPGSRLTGVGPIDVTVATGGVFANVASPAQAALIVLDTLPLRGISSLALDSAGIASSLGMVGVFAPDLAARLVETDALSQPLGPVITIEGAAPDGEVAVNASLELADGRKLTIEALQGTLTRLPLAPGERALLSLQPHPDVSIGLGAGRPAKASEPIEGGALGVIIDTRARPITLPVDTESRIARLREWRTALGLPGETSG